MSKLTDYINNNLSFREEYERIFGKTLPYGKCMCCFHENTHTPAAKMYDNVMHCFVCGKSFTVSDLLYKFDRSRIDEISQTVIASNSTQQVSKKNLLVQVDKSLSLSEIYKTIINEIRGNQV